MKDAKTRAALRVTKLLNRRVRMAREAASWTEYHDAMRAAQLVALCGSRLAAMSDEREIANLLDELDAWLAGADLMPVEDLVAS